MSGHGSVAEIDHGDHGDDPFTKRVSLSIAVFAVILAAAATGGKNAGKELIVEQLSASNTWNQYQAKSQREVLYQQERLGYEREFGTKIETSEIEQLLAALKEAGYKPQEKKDGKEKEKEEKKSAAEELANAYDEIEKLGNSPIRIKDDKLWRKARYVFVLSKLREYRDKEHKESMPSLSDKARKHEAARDLAHKKDPYFDFAELLLQIAIVLASITLLSKATWPYIVGVLLALIGLFLTLNGFLLFVELPFLSGGH